MDLNKAIRLAVDSGKVELGASTALKAALNGSGVKLIIVAKNCPKSVKSDLEHYSKLSGVHLLEFNGSNTDLGVVCGKPFSVSALTVFNEGDSDLLQAVR